MTKPKFTPGPWWVLHEGSSEVSVQSDGASICTLNLDPRPKEVVKKHLANARLIAAAPELYEACRFHCETRCKMRNLNKNVCKNCLYGKALRKARGESEVSE